MTNLQNYCEFAKVDSLKLSVPINFEPKRIKKSTFRHDTGEIEKEIEVLDYYENKISGITFGCGYQYVPSIRQYQKYYLVNSKHNANENYFLGINKDNITNIYENLMSNIPNQFHCDKLDFTKNASCSDLDICIDIMLDTISNVEPFYSHLYECFYPIYDSNNIKLYKDNGFINAFGIANRDTANNKIPYFKIYHKGFELNNKSLDFKREFLSSVNDTQLDYLNRSEVTFKYGRDISGILKNNKIDTVLNSNIDRMYTFKNSSHFGKKFNYNIRQSISKSLNAYEMSFVNFMLSDKNKISIDEFLNRTIHKGHIKYECRKAKNRQLKRNIELFHIYENLKNSTQLF